MNVITLADFYDSYIDSLEADAECPLVPGLEEVHPMEELPRREQMTSRFRGGHVRGFRILDTPRNSHRPKREKYRPRSM